MSWLTGAAVIAGVFGTWVFLACLIYDGDSV